ncbi:hypothetical protein ACQV2B_19940 [Pantoea allii]|uniref:hypothetical protein n=1 Tax=Pantoea allii TaxID=574096 RepID=UPI0039774A70
MKVEETMKLKFLVMLGIMTPGIAISAGDLTCSVVEPSGAEFTASERSATIFSGETSIGSVTLCGYTGTDVRPTMLEGRWFYRENKEEHDVVMDTSALDQSNCNVFGTAYTALGMVLLKGSTIKETNGWEGRFTSRSENVVIGLAVRMRNSTTVHALHKKEIRTPTGISTRSITISDLAMKMYAGDSLTEKLTVTTTNDGSSFDSSLVTYKIRPDGGDSPVVTFEDGTDTVTVSAPYTTRIKVQVPKSLGSGSYSRVLDAIITCP